MDQYEEAYQRIGLTVERQQEFKALSRLFEEVPVASSALLIETVIISENKHEVVHREISRAKLVRTVR